MISKRTEKIYLQDVVTHLVFILIKLNLKKLNITRNRKLYIRFNSFFHALSIYIYIYMLYINFVVGKFLA